MMLVSAVISLTTEVLDCVEFTIWESCSYIASPFSSLELIASACAVSSVCFAPILTYTLSERLAAFAS